MDSMVLCKGMCIQIRSFGKPAATSTVTATASKGSPQTRSRYWPRFRTRSDFSATYSLQWESFPLLFFRLRSTSAWAAWQLKPLP